MLMEVDVMMVFVVDDDCDICDFVVFKLMFVGYIVLTVVDGDDVFV